MRPIRLLFISLISQFLFSSCSENKNESVDMIDSLLSVEKTNLHENNFINSDEINMLMGTVPPPLEISSMISGEGFVYKKHFLHSIENIKDYHDSYTQAFYIGVYGTDLGYTQLFHNVGDGIAYFEAVYSLAQELKIESYFDKKLMKQLTKGDQIDSLINQTTYNFENINDHFLEEKTPELSIMILLGGWIESLNLLTETYVDHPSEALANRIAEQQLPLEIIIEILKKYDENKRIKEMHNHLKPIIRGFSKIEIVEEELDDVPEHVWQEDGTLLIAPSVETKIIVEKEDFDALIKTIISTRKSLFL